MAFLNKITGLFSSSLPNRLYNQWLSFPPVQASVNYFAKLLIPATIKIAEGELMLNRQDVGVSFAMAFGLFEKTEVAIFQKTLKPAMNVLDIGANIGYYTVIAGKLIGPTGKVFAFEPEKTNATILKKNLAINKLSNVVVEEQAVSDTVGERTFFLAENNKGAHAFVNNRNTNEKIIVKTDTVDHALSKYGSPKIDIIKMDIEGAEVLALEGMLQTIACNPELIIFTEFYPKALNRLEKSPLEFLNRLKELGFNLFEINEDVRQLVPLTDFNKFISEFPDYECAKNIYATKIK